VKRRNFLGFAAFGAVSAATNAFAQRAPDPTASLTAQRSGANSALPDWSKLKTRQAAKVEVLYKTTHGKPNGLALTNTPGEMWVIDQGTERWITLTKIADGSVIREFQSDVVGPSGVVVDDNNVMWLTSTHNSLIISIDPSNGKTIAKYITPGAGRIYSKRGDPPARSSKLPVAYPDLSRAVDARTVQPAQAGRIGSQTGAPPVVPAAAAAAPAGEGAPRRNRGPQMPPGQLPLDTEEGAGGTGAHGILSKGDLLIYANPPSRAIYTINQKTWQVQDIFPTPGNRPHGMTWNDAAKTSFWCADSNLNAFYHYDLATGQILEKVQVGDDPYAVLHGAKLVLNGPGAGYMYFCDDVGWMCRIKWSA
jgi:DNA-binding beta-propeller fold protein YncE